MDVLGVGVSCIDVPYAIDVMSRWVANGERHYVCITGMHGVMESQSDPELREIHNRSGLTTPDGMPMVWAGRWAGAKIDRVYGPDLMWATLAESPARGWSHYFLGGEPGVAERLIDQARRAFPGLSVAGCSCPPYRPLSAEEERELVQRVNAAGPDFVWVALGTPKQERWMARQRPHLDAAALVGIGAAFALLTGTVRQAPAWMQRSGLEWAFRLAVEPRRLWRRYLLNIPCFLAKILRHPPRLREVAHPDS